jgi:hypothetical protein
MATLTPLSLSCGGCGARVYGAVTDRINAETMPWVVENLLDGRFHRFDCQLCGAATVVENQLLYMDLARKHWVGMFPPHERGQHAECARVVRASFEAALVATAPPALARAAEAFAVRVVFGVGELREKVMAWHAGMDDAVLEVLKLDLMAQQPLLLARGLVGLVLDGILADSTLRFRPVYAQAAAEDAVQLSVAGEAYVEALREWPRLRAAHAALAAGPYVSIRRYQWPDAPVTESRP